MAPVEILPPAPLVLLIPMANLPPVATTPVAMVYELYYPKVSKQNNSNFSN
jgi:hypothetical protein